MSYTEKDKSVDLNMSIEEVISSLSPMPLLTISSPQTIEKCSQLSPRQTDIFISSYPKSGTTWTQHIVISLLLLHQKKASSSSSSTENLQNLQYEHVSDFAPFYEIDAHWDDDDLIDDIRRRHKIIGRRIFNTHLRGNMLPANGNDRGKVIYVIRSPLDTCISFYHHLSNQNEGCYEKGLNHFFKEWMAGDIPFGSWSDHLLSYAPLMASDNVMVLSYEKMVQDLQSSVERIVKFLALDDVITINDVKDLLPTFEFSSMKNNLDRFQPKSVTWRNDFKFLRKGVIGNHKETLSDAQIKSFKDQLEKRRFYDKLRLMIGDASEGMRMLGVCSDD